VTTSPTCLASPGCYNPNTTLTSQTPPRPRQPRHLYRTSSAAEPYPDHNPDILNPMCHPPTAAPTSLCPSLMSALDHLLHPTPLHPNVTPTTLPCQRPGTPSTFQTSPPCTANVTCYPPAHTLRGPFPGARVVQAHMCGRLPRDTLIAAHQPDIPSAVISSDIAYFFRWGGQCCSMSLKRGALAIHVRRAAHSTL